MPHDLTISDAEIDAVGRDLRIDLSDEERRNVLRATRTCDIQACPGGGKTTLLVAKLSILADKWVWPDRGICVLSHTNVARHEVERRLAAHVNARRVPSYPHFIGTIQTFVDQFLALPQLRDEGVEVHVVDNDRFGEASWHAYRSVQHPDLMKARAYLKRRRDPEQIVKGLRFTGPSLQLHIPIRSPPGPSTSTHAGLLWLKERIRRAGVLRFDDMYAYAERRIAECPGLVSAIRYRFPWVFIDEMQDTNDLQDSLLEKLFGKGVTLQRFGDANQAIFGGGEDERGQSSFPCQSTGAALTVTKSKRFGARIASFASRFTVVQAEILKGRPVARDRRHTVFTFDPDSIHKVLPAFGALVLQEFDGCDMDVLTFKAVGFRKKPELSATTNGPRSLGDYWTKFDPVVSATNRHFERFIDYVRAARQSVRQDGECAKPYRTMLSAFLSLLDHAGAKTSDLKRFSRNTLIATLAETGAKDQFCELMRVFCLGDTAPDQAQWKTGSDRIDAVLEPLLQSQPVADVVDFLGWAASGASLESPEPESLTRRSNIYRYEQNGRAVSIEVTTIHAVKGETHTGTLLLETFWNKHDLGDACAWLADGAKRTEAILGVEKKERLKRLYVAATRPTDLLCLAMHRDRFRPCLREDLKKEGWSIVDLA